MPVTSLAAQWLRLRAANAESAGSIPGQGTKILNATQCGQRIKHQPPPHPSKLQYQKTPLSYLLKMPPKSEALRHSGGERRLFTSAMVTLYLEVELRRDRRPGTEQNKSVGLTTQVPPLEGKVYYILMTMSTDTNNYIKHSYYHGGT